MLIPGLVSVTFRKFDKFKVASLARKAGLREIEWGGDVHVPVNNDNAVRNAVISCLENKVEISSYGSSFRCKSVDGIDENIAAASGIGARYMRIWAGTKYSCDATPDERRKTVEIIKETCRKAAPYGIKVCTECHIETLTDDYESALRLVDEVAEDNFGLYWQPNQFRDTEYNLKACRATLPYMTNVHVFHWSADSMFPLEVGKDIWSRYIDIISSDGKEHSLQLEFVVDGSTDQFFRDAETLHGLLEKYK